MSVAKGGTIGTSGASGTYVKARTPEDPSETTRPRPHLHVHLRAFRAKDIVTSSHASRGRDRGAADGSRVGPSR